MTAAASTAIDVTEHFGLAHAIARRYARAARGAALEHDDLVQAAMIGAMRAAQLYQPMRAKPSTYLGLWMRQGIQRTVADHGTTVRVPVHLQVTRGKRGERQRALVYSLDNQISADGDGTDTYLDLLAAPDASPDALAEREQADRRRVLGETMRHARLTRKERYVLERRHATEPATLRQIGERMGVCRERIRQIEGKALRKLRTAAAVLGASLP